MAYEKKVERTNQINYQILHVNTYVLNFNFSIDNLASFVSPI